MKKKEDVSDPNCNQFKNGKCIKCSFGFYFNIENVCIQVPSECKSYDTKEQRCYQCYDGYELNSYNLCLKKDKEVSDPNCNQFKNGRCTKCSFGFYFNKQDKCIGIPS